MSTYAYDIDPELEVDLDSPNGDYYEDPEFFRRGRGTVRARPAAPTRPYTPAPTTPGNYVTKPELERALGAVRSDMQKNATAIRGVSSQVEALGARTRRELAASRTETRNSTQLLTLLPLLTSSSFTVSRNITEIDDAGNPITVIPEGTKLATAGDSLTSVLPLLLLSGGMGGQQAQGGASGGGGFDPMMMMVLVLALRPKS